MDILYFNETLPHDRLVNRFVNDIFGEALQKPRVLSLVDCSQYGSRRPASRVHNRAISNLAIYVIPRNLTQIGICSSTTPPLLSSFINHSVADKNHCQVNPEASILVLWCFWMLNTLVANHLVIKSFMISWNDLKESFNFRTLFWD